MTGIIYRLFGAAIKRRLAANEFRPRDFRGLSFAFTDLQGREYYSWPDIGAMPPVRVKEVEAIMVMVHVGTGDEHLKELGQAIIDKANEVVRSTGKAKDDAAASVVVLARELLFRRESIIPEEAYYALAAVCCARRDEEPLALDRVVHAEKIATFRAAAQAGAPFFLPSACFKALLGASLCTEVAFAELRHGWMIREALRSAVMKACQ